MNFLPIEMWHHVFSFLTNNDILNSRTVCKQWNTISLATLKLNIRFRNNEDVANFFEMIKQSVGGLKVCNFFFNIEDHSISAFNLTELSKEIGSYATSYYFIKTTCSICYQNCDSVECVQYDIINIMLNATPNLRMLHIYTDEVFPEPNFHPLKQLEELHLKRRKGPKGVLRYWWREKIKFELVTNWIIKAPSLKKFNSNFLVGFQDTSKKDFQLLRGIPEVCLNVQLSQDYEKQLEELQLVSITELCLQISDVNEELCRALYVFLENQSASLRTLYFRNLTCRRSLTLPLPLLPKLETFEADFEFDIRMHIGVQRNINFSIDPKNLIYLKKVHFHKGLQSWELNPFGRGEYPTVTKLVLKDYSRQNWKNLFPNLRKLKVYITGLCGIKHLLADLPTDNYIVLRIKDISWIDYLIHNPFPVARLKIDLDCRNSILYPNMKWNIKSIYGIQSLAMLGSKRRVYVI